MTARIEGEVVEDFTLDGHHFQIEKLRTPVQRGAGLRYFRLWHNGKVASGGAWHYTANGAWRRAAYVTEHHVIQQRDRLMVQVNLLERENARLRAALAECGVPADD